MAQQIKLLATQVLQPEFNPLNSWLKEKMTSQTCPLPSNVCVYYNTYVPRFIYTCAFINKGKSYKENCL